MKSKESRELKHDIADKAKSVAQREAQKLGIDWFSVRVYEGLLMRTIVDYADKFEKLIFDVQSEMRGGKVYYTARYFTIACRIAKVKRKRIEKQRRV